jgi:D-tyrosyl-tRNA(Tyr) deacylase
MRAVLQRVKRASVSVGGEVVASIGPGLLILVGVAAEDTPEEAARIAKKAADLRIFSDAQDKFNVSLLETGGEAIVVSNFTLFADVRKGRRPSFAGAAAPADAAPIVDAFADALRGLGVNVGTGRFGNYMQVSIENDGPVTIVLDTEDLDRPRRASAPRREGI